MAQKSAMLTQAPATRSELLETLAEWPEAQEIVQTFFNKSRKPKAVKFYQAVLDAKIPDSFPATGKEVFGVLQGFAEPVTLEVWAENVENFGRSKSAISAVKTYGRLLEMIGVIQES